jgi:hypothetical protein
MDRALPCSSSAIIPAAPLGGFMTLADLTLVYVKLVSR